MSVVKVRIQKDFTVLYNGVLENPRLSFKAKGLWAYCMSKSEDWQFHVRHLATVSKDGVDAVYSALKELEVEGLVEKNQKNEGGSFGQMDYIIYPYPQEIQKILPLRDFPHTEDSHPVNPHIPRTDLKPRIEEEIKDSSSSSSLRSSSSDFKKEMMGMMKELISATEEEFEEAWRKYQLLDPDKIPHPKAWFVAVIENNRPKPESVAPIMAEKKQTDEDRAAIDEWSKRHRKIAEAYEAKYPKFGNPDRCIVCFSEYVDIRSGKYSKTVRYDVNPFKWQEETGWES